MTGAIRLAALFGVPAVAVILVASLWLGDDEEDGAEIRDVLITRDATLYAGQLDGCNATNCELEGRNYDRRRIGFIGLGVESPIPPMVSDPSRDELHLHDGSTVYALFAQLDDDRVFAGARNFERAQVAWIYLAPEPVDPAPVLAGDDEETDPEPDSAEQAEDSESGSVPESAGRRQARRPLENPVLECPSDKPLGGHVRVREIYEDVGVGYNCRAEASFWFPLHASYPPGNWPQELGVSYKSDTVHYRMRNFGCRDVDIPGRTQNQCTQPAGAEVAGDQHYGDVGPYGIVPNGEHAPFSFNALLPELSLGRLPSKVLEATVVGGECRDSSGFLWGATDWAPSFLGTMTVVPQEYAIIVDVEPTGCYDDDGSRSRECTLRPDYYAAIPFIGSRNKRWESTDGNQEMTYTWALCCGCAEDQAAAPWPDTDPGDDKCGPPTIQRALLDTALEQQKAILRPLGDLLRKQQAIQNEANQWYNDFQHATRDCQLWGAARTLVGILASGGAPGVSVGGLRVPAAQSIPQTKEFWNFLSWAEKVSGGDPSWLLPNHEFADWVSIEDAWDGFTIAYGALGPSSPQSLREGLQQCGAPTIEGVLDGAYKYLGLIEQLPALGEGINGILNRARGLDQEIFDFWQKWQQACREHERCTGGDPSRCDTPPQSSLF